MKNNKILPISLLSICLFLPLTIQAAIPTKISSLFEANAITQNSVVIGAPAIAESGAVVSVKIEKINRLPKGVTVTDIILFNEFRDEPVATFSLGPKMIPTSLVTRVKMRESGKIFVIAKLSNGKVFSGEKLIKVTEGGCGGGAVKE